MKEIKYDLVNDAASQASAKLYLNEDLADVNFLFESDAEIQKVPANKSILAVLSPVFNAMFFGPKKELGDVKIVDATIDTFKEFLQLFYLNNVTITMANIECVIRLADKYDVLEYLNVAANLLINKLTLENMCWGYQLALMISNETLQEHCEKYIRGYPIEIFKSATFKQCDRMVLKYILQLNSMGCKEHDVFDACLTWAEWLCRKNKIDESKSVNLRAQLGDCFNFIRFGAMKSVEFATHTVLHRNMFSSEELSELLYTTAIENFKSNTFNHEPRSHPTFQWNDDQEIACILENATNNRFAILLNSITVCFSVNQPVLLGNIYFHRLQKKKDDPYVFPNFKINITEHDDQSLSSWRRTIYSHSKHLITQHPCIKLAPPVLINPTKMYEISLQTSSPSDYYYYYLVSNSNITLDPYITVQFHNFNSNSNSTGPISRLSLCRL